MLRPGTPRSALDTDRKDDLIDTWIPRIARRPFRRFAGIEGSRTYACFEARDLRYFTARVVKRTRALPEVATARGPAQRVGPVRTSPRRGARTNT